MTIATVIVPDHVELTELPDLAGLPDFTGLPDLAELPDAALLALQGEIAASRRRLDAVGARVSAELSRRSAPELGYAGLAQRSGLRTPEALLQQISGVTKAEARSMIRVGHALDGSSPWLAAVAVAVSAGQLSIAAADGIAVGLGVPTADVAADDLADAALRLVAVAGQTMPERIAAAARSIRDDLDAVGVADREEAMRNKRFLRLIPQSDGMTKIFGLLDPESAAIVGSAVDALTAPRRGGPRFVDLAEVARSERIAKDPRSTDQIAVDGLVDIVKLAVAADKGKLFGNRAPVVRLHVTVADLAEGHGLAKGHGLANGNGAAQLEGQSTAVSLATAKRLACGSGYVPVLFDGSQPLDVGRSERLFTNRQRIALAARDGGCIFPECERPPAWCEAHHCEHWARDEGRTDTALGVLLCRHHHMLVHNNHWEIAWEREKYWFIPPIDIDPSQRPVAAQSRGHGASRR